MSEYDVVAEIRADLKNYTTSIDNAISKMQSFENGVSKSTANITKVTSKIGTGMMVAGAGITAMAYHPPKVLARSSNP